MVFGQPAQEDLVEFPIEKVGAERLEEVMGEVVVNLAAGR